MGESVDLLQNPFYILAATTRDNHERIADLAEERSLLLDANECTAARLALTAPRKRLAAEVAWLPGIGPKRTEEVLLLLNSHPKDMLAEDNLPPVARANALAAALAHLPEDHRENLAEWITELAQAFDDIDPEQLKIFVNEERIVAGFPEIADVAAVEDEIQERRWHYRQVIKTALDNLPSKDLVEAVTEAVESATNVGEEYCPVLIADLVDAYEVEAQEFLDKEEENIVARVKKLRAAVDANSPDSILAPRINKLIEIVKNWDFVAQPIQVCAKSRGLDHKASIRVARMLRNFAIYLFNEHGKLNASQQLTNMLQEVFAEVGEIAERTAEDADTLNEIAEQQAFHLEVSEIEELSAQIKADVDNGKPDTYLSPKINQLCQLVRDWKLDPDHNASQFMALIVRDLSIHLFNKHNKLSFAQQLIKVLLGIFNNAGEISERIADDVKALQKIAANHSKLASQFREFNLNGNSFSFKGRTYNTNDILHIGFYRAVTTHKVNFIGTGKTEEANIYLTMAGGQKVTISVDEQGIFFNRNKSAQIKTVVEFYSYLSYVTFDRRLEFYESQIKQNGYFEYDKCYFYPHKKIVFRGRDFDLSSNSFLRSYGCIEIRKKDFGIVDKIKREVALTKIPQFSTIIDTDVIFHLLDKYFSLRWSS